MAMEWYDLTCLVNAVRVTMTTELSQMDDRKLFSTELKFVLWVEQTKQLWFSQNEAILIPL